MEWKWIQSTYDWVCSTLSFEDREDTVVGAAVFKQVRNVMNVSDMRGVPYTICRKPA